MKTRIHIDKSALLSTLIVLSAGLTGTLAQNYDLSWYTIDSGGEMWTTGGDFELSGTIGQADASSSIMAGGEFELSTGFWPGVDQFCFGDLDGNGEIGLGDLATLLGSYGETGGMAYENGDLDGDGDVDLSDLAALLGVYGENCP